MTVLAFQTRRAKRCDTRALELLRAEVKSDLLASKNRESRALRALVRAAEFWVAAGWLFAFIAICALAVSLMGAAAALGLEIGHAAYQYLTK